MKDEFEDGNGIESAQADFTQVPMRKPRSKSVKCMFLKGAVSLIFCITLNSQKTLFESMGSSK